jgi:hypothetical protein
VDDVEERDLLPDLLHAVLRFESRVVLGGGDAPAKAAVGLQDGRVDAFLLQLVGRQQTGQPTAHDDDGRAIRRGSGLSARRQQQAAENSGDKQKKSQAAHHVPPS